MECTLDRYTNYLLSTTTSATATGMSELFDGNISHDKVTRFLSNSYLDSSTVWQKSKPLVRQYQSADEGVLIADDTIIEKAYTDENAMICWHWDHSQGRNVKGINLLTLLYSSQDLNTPVAVHLVEKTEGYVDAASGQTKYRSPKSKNEITREMLLTAESQQVQWRYFLADSWFSSAETMEFIHNRLKKSYVMAVESSRTVAVSQRERFDGRFERVDAIAYPDDGSPLEVYLRSVKHRVLLVRRVFTNKDGSQGVQYLLSNDTTLNAEQVATIYKRRWKVEEYHKSLKQHTAIGKSPTKTVETQANHIYASIIAYIKLEGIKLGHGMNHFGIKSALLAVATKAAFLTLRQFFA